MARKGNRKLKFEKKWKGTIDDDDENNSLYILNRLSFCFALGVVVVVPTPVSLNSSKSF